MALQDATLQHTRHYPVVGTCAGFVQASVSMDPVQVDLDRCLASSPPFTRGRVMDQDFPAMVIVSGAGLHIGKESAVVEKTCALVV
ncbi:hypothetical protein PoB_004667800 [Plakobranchus ocellatus]|uniref:Uncharacterized protein n=1 Tax=Plakobranchus ocellatus TaxID=259542 RepID=A0AAV4BMZ7_9GAST|nr:hypothetical protein PoB_004667800 [Plakobranchus ocellatus]